MADAAILVTTSISRGCQRLESSAATAQTTTPVEAASSVLAFHAKLASPIKRQAIFSLLSEIGLLLRLLTFRSCLLAICETLETVKAVEAMYHRHTNAIFDVVSHALQHLSYVVVKMIAKAKRSLDQDQDAALIVAENAAIKTPCDERLVLLRVSLTIASKDDVFK